MAIALYPGTFDPVTNGHIDLMKRCLRLFDKLIVGVADNPRKGPLFTVEDRVAFIREATRDWENFEVYPFDNLLIDFVKEKGANLIVKGLRAVSDFEFELQLSSMNRKLDSRIESIFMMPSEEFSFLSSRIIKEIASLGGDVSTMVPANVLNRLREEFNR